MPAEHTRREDPRIKKTELRLRRALFENLAAVGTNRLSVATITATAGVTRGTFYQHYADKQDFLRSVRRDTVLDFFSACVFKRADEVGKAPRLHVRLALDYLRRPENGIATLLKYDEQAFLSELSAGMKNMIAHYLDEKGRFGSQTDIQTEDLVMAATVINVAIFKEWTLGTRGWQVDYATKLVVELNKFAPGISNRLAEFYC